VHGNGVNLYIELDGQQHFKPTTYGQKITDDELQRRRDVMKMLAAVRAGHSVVRLYDAKSNERGCPLQ
jgi:hypothetical protein